jgi:hypothetical protein
MAKYKIKVVGLLLRNNQMAEFGDIVDEESFSSPAEELKKQGYIDLATKADFKKLKETEEEEAKRLEEEEAARLAEEEEIKKLKEAEVEAEAKRLEEEAKAGKK